MTADSNAPLISVLIPAYNAERFLAASLDSVLAQTFTDFEILAIDDGSKDRTGQILRDYAAKDGRVRAISHENMGMGRSLNDALERARGPWIARLDADDLMAPNRLERQLDFVAKHPDVVVASSLVKYIDEHGKSIGQNRSKFTTPEGVKAAVDANLPVGFHHPAVLMKRDVIKQLGGYRPEFWPADDMDLWNRVVDAGYAVLVQDEYLTSYRIHGASVTVGKFRDTERKAQWVEACMRARRAKQPEPTREQFEAEFAKQRWTARLNTRRRDHARAIYKAAVFHYSRKDYLRFIPQLLAAGMLEPWYVIQRVMPQLRGQPAAAE